MSSDTLLTAGTIGAMLFVVTFLVEGALRPGYHPMYHAVSALALGPRGWIQATNFIVCGSLITASALGILLADGGAVLAAPIFVFGVALVVSGIFPMDPMRGYPPGAPAGTPTTTSRAHRIHDRAGMVVFATFPFVAAVAAFTLEDTGWVIYSAASAVIAVGLVAAFVIAFEHDHPLTGLAQRGAIIVGWVWLAATCWHLTG